jgi:cobalt-zinc-cadmium efflux system outer membrane protein
MMRVFVLSIGLWLAFAVQAESTRPLLEQAREVDPEAHLLKGQLDALEQTAEAQSRWSPEAPTLTLGTINDRLNGDNGAEEWEVALEWPLWLPGQQDAGQRVYALRQQIVQAELAQRDWQLSGLLRQASWSLALAEQRQRFARARQITMLELEADAQRGLQAGSLAEGELLEIETDRLEADAALADAQSAYTEAQAQWQRLSGGHAPMLPGEAVVSPPEVHPQRALSTLRIAMAQLLSQQTRLNRRGIPSAGVLFRQDRPSRNSDFEQMMGLSITIPFSTAGHYVTDEAEAERGVTAAQINLRAVVQELSLAQIQARTQFELAGARLPIAQRKNTLAVRGLQLAEQAYGNGEITHTDRLKKQLLVEEASYNLKSKELALLQAIANLNQSYGVSL